MKILANDGIENAAKAKFNEMGFEVDEGHYDVSTLKEKIKEFDVLIVRSATKFTKEIIDEAEGGKLKIVIRAGVGLDNIDVDYATKKGIEVKNTPNASSNSVAELVIGHMFSLARFISISNVTMRKGQWNKKEYEGLEINGKTLGIIGFGRIGKTLAKKAKALGMKVLFTDTIIKTDKNFEYKEMDKLLSESDFISVHTPFTGTPIIGKDEFQKMKKGVFIINASRGQVVDEKMLLKGLNEGLVRGAGIDVFEKEPTLNLELVNHPRVSATPHIGAATKEAQERIAKEIVEIVTNFIFNPIDKAI